MSQPTVPCPKCYTPVPAGAISCASCGTAMPLQPPATAPGQMPLVPVPRVASPKEKIPAGLLALFLGGLGVHHFYLGKTGWGIAFLLVTVLSCGWGALLTHPISLVQGVLYLVSSDADFQQKYVVEQRFF